MTAALNLPAPDATAEDWGRLAASIPGWVVMPGMLDTEGDRYVYLGVDGGKDAWPDPDDPATEGCMVRLLGPVHEAVWYTGDCDRWVVAVGEERRLYTSLGRACIAAAAAIGRWPGGEG
jgi:hypothetical protein